MDQASFVAGAECAIARVFKRLDDIAHCPDSAMASMTRMIISDALETPEQLVKWTVDQDSPDGKAARGEA